MSAFTIPGVELEQVLEACKTPAGKEAYLALVESAQRLVRLVETGSSHREKKRSARHQTEHARTVELRALGVLRRLGGWVAPKDLAEHAGISQQPLKNALARLLERGDVEVKGQTRARRYRALEQDEPDVPEPPSTALVAQMDSNGSGTVQGRVLLATRYKAGTVSELAGRLNLPVPAVRQALEVLEGEGELKRCGRRRGEIVFRCDSSLGELTAA